MGQEIATHPTTPQPASTHWKVGPWRTGSLIVLPLLALLYVIFAARSVRERADHMYLPAEHSAAAVVTEPNGAALYSQNCARCHGTRGNADGVTSLVLD